MSFALSKWYLDCVSEEGDAFIAYSAELRWGALSVRYTGTLLQRAGRATEARATLRTARAPAVDGEAITWSAPALGLAGRWAAIEARAVADTVFESAEGSVVWRCHQPRARAEVVLPGAPPLRGLGYAEHLRVTLPPWQMPIDELRWGRFLGDDASLVWIDWRGPHRRRLALLDGELVEPVRVGDVGPDGGHPHPASPDGGHPHSPGVEAGPARLSISAGRVLRRGALGKTALAVLPAAQAILPVRILATEERKWLARGTLERGGRTSQGWVIHEVVRWP